MISKSIIEKVRLRNTNSILLETLKKIAKRKPSMEKASAAFFKSREEAREVLEILGEGNGKN